MIKFGSESPESVPVYWGDWRPAPEELYRQSYRKTYNLKLGQSWFDLEIGWDQIEAYAMDELGRAVPVDALVAGELKTEGAKHVAFVETWTGGVVLVDQNLVCIVRAQARSRSRPEIWSPTRKAGNALWQIIQRVKETPQGLSGFPDVLCTVSR